jgi:aldose 1-epimerase
LRFRGAEVLRTMRQSSKAVLDSSCFPLIPYCNRLKDGRFQWRGHAVSLPLNFLPELNTLHGLGWQSSWEITEKALAKVDLRCANSTPDSWIWPYRAEQTITLDDRGCTIALSLANTGSETMPAGLGLHPYFRRRPETRVRFDAETVMLSDGATMPTGIEAPAAHFGDFAAGAVLLPETIDHCYRNWGGTVTIEDDLGTIAMTASGAPHLHLYAPADGSALCCEPVSHTPDALNRAPEEMIAVEPGQTARLAMRITAN